SEQKNPTTTKGAKSTFGLSIQGSKQLPPPPLLTDAETNPTTAKIPDKKEVKMDSAQLQLLLDKFAQQFEDATKRIIKANNEYNKNNQPKKVNYCDTTEEIYSNEVWEEELYNVDQPRRGKQKEQIPENDESGDHDEDDADKLFDELEYESEELEELESFSSDCVPSDEESAEGSAEESAEETEKQGKIAEIESPAVCLAVMEEIPTGKK
ncbi:10081_t:CDS:2, partial [Dentiscutata heterogama]